MTFRYKLRLIYYLTKQNIKGIGNCMYTAIGCTYLIGLHILLKKVNLETVTDSLNVVFKNTLCQLDSPIQTIFTDWSLFQNFKHYDAEIIYMLFI